MRIDAKEWLEIGIFLNSLKDFEVERVVNEYSGEIYYTADSNKGTLPCRYFEFHQDGSVQNPDGYIMCDLNSSQMKDFINMLAIGVTRI